MRLQIRYQHIKSNRDWMKKGVRPMIAHTDSGCIHEASLTFEILII